MLEHSFLEHFCLDQFSVIQGKFYTQDSRTPPLVEHFWVPILGASCSNKLFVGTLWAAQFFKQPNDPFLLGERLYGAIRLGLGSLRPSSEPKTRNPEKSQKSLPRPKGPSHTKTTMESESRYGEKIRYGRSKTLRRGLRHACFCRQKRQENGTESEKLRR